MLKIYGIDPSTWTNAVRFTANALGLDYEFVRLDLASGEGQKPEYLAIHPAGKIPAIDDDGFTLFESGAIQRYLAARAGSPLYPSGLQQRALVDQWSLFAANHIGNGMGKVLFNRVIHELFDAPSNQAELEEGLGYLDRFLPIVDAQLGRSTHLAAEDLTIADLVLMAWLDPAEVAAVDLAPYANISAWRSRLQQEAFYTACYPSYTEMFQAVTARMQEGADAAAG